MSNEPSDSTKEEIRLLQDKNRELYWKQWGPYLSERQWGTVREDYSQNGDAWNYLPYESSRSRTYRWGEDGIGGFSDTHQYICISFAFWNEKDDHLKERLFGLTGPEGNHGEDVKEIYHYADNTPTHSYMKYQYKYPQTEFPYKLLRTHTAKLTRHDKEFELTDTGVFDSDKYWDIYIEYAKCSKNPQNTVFRIVAYNRSDKPAPLHIVPQITYRNTWTWGTSPHPKPHLERYKDSNYTVALDHWKFKNRYFTFVPSPSPTNNEQDIRPKLLFTENESNHEKLYKVKNTAPYVKDAFHERICSNNMKAVNPKEEGTKACGWYNFQNVPPGECAVVRLVFNNKEISEDITDEEIDIQTNERAQEAEEFYFKIASSCYTEELRQIQRQAFSGMLWNKQYYKFIWTEWMNGDPTQIPPPETRKNIRNQDWKHLHIDDVLSMPDKWEYPYFCVWDSAFHCIPLAMIDPEFAKMQLDRLTHEWFMHPNGQLPAYEWNFSDVNPPVHAWATYRVFKIERAMYGREDLVFLEKVFQKLLFNFTWWVNRKDESGRNVFEGGFLGLDNIGLFNRSETLPTGGILVQSDATGWMAFYCLNMLSIALELAAQRPAYEDIASKFFEHFLFIADAMVWTNPSEGNEFSLWNAQDGFYYDAITWPNRKSMQLKIRSLVGLIPLFAVTTIEPQLLDRFPNFRKRLQWFVKHRPEVAHRNIASIKLRGHGSRLLLALVNKERLEALLKRMLDQNEFLSDFGIRSLSKYHEKNIVSMQVNNQLYTLSYVPGESISGMFGGNSNWRGPIWIALNFLLIESLRRFYMFYGEDMKIEFPTDSGDFMNLSEIAEVLQQRILRLFLKDEEGRRPCNGGNDLMDFDAHFENFIIYNEYFDGDTGRGLGASHQLGWTGLIAKIIYDLSEKGKLPRTPKTPRGIASHYFDEVLGEHMMSQRRRHSNYSSTTDLQQILKERLQKAEAQIGESFEEQRANFWNELNEKLEAIHDHDTNHNGSRKSDNMSSSSRECEI